MGVGLGCKPAGVLVAVDLPGASVVACAKGWVKRWLGVHAPACDPTNRLKTIWGTLHTRYMREGEPLSSLQEPLSSLQDQILLLLSSYPIPPQYAGWSSCGRVSVGRGIVELMGLGCKPVDLLVAVDLLGASVIACAKGWIKRWLEVG